MYILRISLKHCINPIFIPIDERSDLLIIINDLQSNSERSYYTINGEKTKVKKSQILSISILERNDVGLRYACLCY